MIDYLIILLCLFPLVLLIAMVAIKLLGNSADDDEENEMAYNIDPTNCAEEALLKTKTKCLQLAFDTDKTTDQIIADAQKFWDFLLKTDEDDETTS